MTAVADTLTSYIEAARGLLPAIRENAPEAERQGRMTDALIEAFRDTRLQRMLVTTDLGGGGLRLPDQLKVIRVLSSGDGATGWSLSFATTGPLFGNLLERQTYDEIFADPAGGIAGAVAPASVVADAVPGGYRLRGKSSNNSAHRFATHLFFGAMVRRDGQVAMAAGAPQIRGFIVPKGQTRIVPNWSASAMIATESDDAVIDDVFVPESYSFHILGGCSTWRGEAERRVPLLSQLGPGLAAQAVGIARGALDAFRDMAINKIPAASQARLADMPSAQLALAEAEGLWMAADALLARSVEEAWVHADAGQPFELDDAVRLRLASVTATRLSRRAVETVREHSGMNVVLRGSPLERFTRDIGAITQHVAVGASRLDPLGKHFMGLPTGSPLV